MLTPADMLAVAYCMRHASMTLTEVGFHSCYLGSEELQVLSSYPLWNVKRLRCVSTCELITLYSNTLPTHSVSKEF